MGSKAGTPDRSGKCPSNPRHSSTPRARGGRIHQPRISIRGVHGERLRPSSNLATTVMIHGSPKSCRHSQLGNCSNGTRSVLISTSEPRGYLRRGVTLKPGERIAVGKGHAEADIIAHAKANGLTAIDIGATKPVCPPCHAPIGNTIHISTPLKKIKILPQRGRIWID